MSNKTSTPRRWTPEEITILRELYPNTPTAKISVRLSRTAASINGKAVGLGLQRSAEYWVAIQERMSALAAVHNSSRGRHWTPEEIAFILANPTLSRSELAAHFATTTGRVYTVVSALRRQGALPAALPYKPKPRPKKERGAAPPAESEEVAKPEPRRVVTTAVRRLPAAKVVIQKEPYNRDLGRVRVQVDARTWKYMLPEVAAKFNQYAR